ncbi:MULTISPECIES: DUF6895 family protein [unclassified Streptomyces]|uniref:DUF6895 family protein n=1 Tax=unclassified Streptomyces TaxID=2593676 RepID=UPI0036EDE44A
MTAAPAARVRDAALHWLGRNRERFALDADALSPDGRADRSWKPLGELAQVGATLTLRTPPGDPAQGRARELLAFAWQQTHDGALFVRLQRAEPFATYPLEVYSAFAAAGLRHPDYERVAATMTRIRGWRCAEQDPTRRLGVLQAERHTGADRGAPLEPILAATWLGGLPEPWSFERSSGYALTHVVFHLTDWGRGGPGTPPAMTAYLHDWLPAWLTTCLEAGMWDLGCELLAVAASLPRPDEALLRESWTRLADAQDASGALPEQDGLSTSGEADFIHTYHSTLMAAFAAGLTVAPAVRTDASRTVRHPQRARAVRVVHDAQGVSG